MSDYIDLRYEVSENIATITLDREEARNAYSAEMIDSLIRALDAAESDNDVRCVIITGAGTTFSGGGDIKLMRAHEGMFSGDPVHLRSNYLNGIQRIPRRLERFDKPIIAAINGPAIGAGLDLACMCDIRVAANGARFGSTFVKIGLIPGDGGAYLLSRVIGFANAIEMVLTGRVVDTMEAERMGLIHEIVLDDDMSVMELARRKALKLCENAPLAMRLAKSAVYQSWDMPMHAALNLAATYQGVAQNTADHDEGLAAMLEGRKAEFKG